MKIPCYGHAGEGNLHATLVKDPSMSMEVWSKNEAECLRALYKVTGGLGGKISGEHGIGIKRKGYLKDLIDPVELRLDAAGQGCHGFKGQHESLKDLRIWTRDGGASPGRICSFFREGEAGRADCN
jgi:hypothetical protein